MSEQRLQELTARFAQVTIAVLGDFFLDKYLDVAPKLAEVSVETGKTAHQVTCERHSPGAAGTIVCNLAALGAGAVHAIGYTGDDGSSYDMRKDLAALNCHTDHLHVVPGRMTPTYLKPRDKDHPGLPGEHSRYDTKNRTPTPEAVQQQMIDSLDQLLPTLKALIVLDQVEERDCGVVTARVRETLADRAQSHRHVVFWADSRHRIRLFSDVLTKVNQFELVGRTNPTPGDRVELDQLVAAIIRARTRTGAPVCVTRGPLGMLVSDPEPTVVPGVRLKGPIDETGAGDGATAGAVLALAAGASLAEAALVGNLVASITVQQLGTTGTASVDELAPRLEMWQDQR
ncbi:MAG: carbohydrate kinase [Planctomycetes bacterium]|nr:carbohydrate kinase [Planctomycetota bacterium]